MRKLALFDATISIRRRPGLEVRPEAEELDGRRVSLRSEFQFDPHHALYAGEWCCTAYPDRAALGEIGWIATGDLKDITFREEAPPS